MIHERKIAGVKHLAYEREKDFKLNHPQETIQDNWKVAEEGQWCYSDDNKIVQVLKRDYFQTKNGVKSHYIRTIIGMVRISKNAKLKGTVKDEIYRFSKKNWYGQLTQAPLNFKRKNFAKYVAYGKKPKEAYKKAFPDTKSLAHAGTRATVLLKNKTIRHQVDKEIENLMSDVGITKRYLLENTKGIVDKEDTRDNDKLRAIETLMKISGMLSADKKVDSVALIQEFTGFTREKLKAFEQGILPEAPKQLDE